MIENESVLSLDDVSFKNSEMTRRLASGMTRKVPVMLIQHTIDDVKMSIWIDNLTSITPQYVIEGGWGDLDKCLNRFHERHTC